MEKERNKIHKCEAAIKKKRQLGQNLKDMQADGKGQLQQDVSVADPKFLSHTHTLEPQSLHIQ